MGKPVELHFLAGEGAVVLDLAAARAGSVRYLGMRLDPEEGGWVPSGEASRLVLVGDHAITDAAAYRKDVRAGHIKPFDRATAEWAGVSWKPAEVPAAAPEPAPDQPGPPAPAEGLERAFLNQERPDAQASATLDETPSLARLTGPAARTQKGR